VEKVKIGPIATPKPLYRSSQKLAGVIKLWTAPGMQNFVAIGTGVFAPQIRDFDVLQGVTNAFLGSCNSLQPTPVNGFLRRIGYAKKVVPAKDVPFGGPGNYI